MTEHEAGRPVAARIVAAHLTRRGLVIACACAVSCGRARAFEIQDFVDVDPAPRTAVVAEEVRRTRDAGSSIVAPPNVVVRAPEMLAIEEKYSTTHFTPDQLSCYWSMYKLLSTWSVDGEVLRQHPDSGLYGCAKGYCKFTHSMAASELSLDQAWLRHGIDEIVGEFTVHVDHQLWPTGPALRGNGRPAIARIGDRWYDVEETTSQTSCPNAMYAESVSPEILFSDALCASRTERCEIAVWAAFSKYLRATLTSAPFAAEEVPGDGRPGVRSVFVRRDKQSLMLGRPYLESSRYVGQMSRHFGPKYGVSLSFDIEAYVLVKKNPNRNEPYRDTTTNEASPYELTLHQLEPARGVCESLRGRYQTSDEGETTCLPRE